MTNPPKKTRRDFVMVSFSPDEMERLIAGMRRHSFVQKASYLKWLWMQYELIQQQNDAAKGEQNGG